MAGVSVNIGVSGIAQFKSAMSDAQASVKTLDAALKNNEKQLKADGDAERYMAAQANALNDKLKLQKSIADNAQKALQQMEANGVSKSSKAYQEMQRRMIEAHSAMLDTQNQINELGTTASDASGKTDQLAASLGGLNKKVSLEQVRSAISSITTGLENAAKKAIDLGQKLWDTIMESASRADDSATAAQMYGIDLDTYLRMQKLVAGGLDTTVENILSAQDKLKRGIGGEGETIKGYLKDLGLLQSIPGKNGETEQLITEDTTKLFWEAGHAILEMGDAYKQEAVATALFGKSWKELKPLFETYKTLDEYNAALEEQTVASEESVRNLAELNDAVGKLESSWTTLKDELLGAIAPALTKGAEALTGLLDKLTEYLKTDEGQEMLNKLGEAVEGLFEGIANISTEEIVGKFESVMGAITDALTWIKDNKESVVTALEAIGIAFAGMKLAGIALDIAKIVSGFKTLWEGANNQLPQMPGEDSTPTPTTQKTPGTKTPKTSNPTGRTSPIGGGAGMAGLGYVAAIALAVDGYLNDKATLRAMQEKGAQSIEEYAGKSATYGGNEYYDLWDLWKKYGTVNGDPADRLKMNDFAEHYMQFWNDEITDPLLDNILGAMTEEQFENFHDIMQRINNGEQFYSEEDRAALSQAVTDMIGVIEGLMEENPIPTEIDPQVPDNAAEVIASQIGTVPVMVSPYSRMQLPGFANGLPYVPFDGYAAVLHKGERVVPAREAGSSRNFSSNLYVESMYMNSGTDAEGLAAAMAAAQRRTMSGYGS